MKTSELTGAALDWAVAQCEGKNSVASCYYEDNVPLWLDEAPHPVWEPSTNWVQGGAIIERERIQITPRGKTTDLWEAIIFDNIFMDDGSDCFQIGATPLEAAMRCYVESELGDEVEVPEELINYA